jgi:two-component system sensor histidine kinase KdpD
MDEQSLNCFIEELRPDPEALLAKLEQSKRARLRIYIGAAPGVGKTYQMLAEAHLLRKQGFDVVIGFVETYGRADTEAMIGDLEIIPRKKINYRGITLEEMDVERIIARRPEICIVDELAHTNVPGSKNKKRYEDVLDLLDAGIHVMTAVNIQHIESLNDVVARSAGVRVRETVPDSFLKRADEIVNVDVTVEELRARLRQGKIYKPEKIEQALANFFRKGNLSTLRELALRVVAEEVGSRAAQYRAHEGLEPVPVPERVMVCISSNSTAKRLLRAGARIAGRLGAIWYAVYVETPREKPEAAEQLAEIFTLAKQMGATVVKLKAKRVSDRLIEFARRENITHVIFGQSARSRLDILLHGSVVNRFLAEVKDAAVQVIPTQEEAENLDEND